jgi:hypothetical protein
MFTREAARTPFPKDILFVEFSWHEWRALDELVVAASWVGEHQESLQCCECLLNEGKLPDEEHERVTGNLEFVQRKLGAAYRVVA